MHLLFMYQHRHCCCAQAKFEQKGDFVAKKRAPKKRKKKLLENQVISFDPLAALSCFSFHMLCRLPAAVSIQCCNAAAQPKTHRLAVACFSAADCMARMARYMPRACAFLSLNLMCVSLQRKESWAGGFDNVAQLNNPWYELVRSNKFCVVPQEERELGWGGFDDVAPATKTTVVLRRMFHPDEFAEDFTLREQLEDDVTGEAAKLGARKP